MDLSACVCAFGEGGDELHIRTFMHKFSKKVHKGKVGDLNALACGKKLSDNYLKLTVRTELDDEVDVGKKRCDSCFASKGGEQ